jgi:hypothetical protein
MKQVTYPVLDFELLVLVGSLITGRHLLLLQAIGSEPLVLLAELLPNLLCLEVSLLGIIILFCSFIEPLFQTCCPLFFPLRDLLLLLKSLSSPSCFDLESNVLLVQQLDLVLTLFDDIFRANSLYQSCESDLTLIFLVQEIV